MLRFCKISQVDNEFKVVLKKAKLEQTIVKRQIEEICAMVSDAKNALIEILAEGKTCYEGYREALEHLELAHQKLGGKE